MRDRKGGSAEGSRGSPIRWVGDISQVDERSTLVLLSAIFKFKIKLTLIAAKHVTVAKIARKHRDKDACTRHTYPFILSFDFGGPGAHNLHERREKEKEKKTGTSREGERD